MRRPGWMLACLVVLGGGFAAADGPVLGEAWEEGIVLGIQDQDRAVATRSPEAVLQEAKSRAQRPADPATTVVRRYLLARAYAKAGDAASARRTYAEVLRLAPRCYFVPRDLAMLDHEKEPADTAGAEKNLRLAIEIHPRYTDALRKLSILYLFELNRPADAIPLLERVAALEPSDLEARYYLARAYVVLERFPDARRELDFLRSRDSRNPAYRQLDADLLLESGEATRARDAYRALGAENPSVAAPLIGYLRALDALAKGGTARDPEEYLWAIERLQRIEKDPKRREHLKASAEEIRRQLSRPDRASEAPSGPPTEADLAQLLSHADPKARTSVLRWLYGQDTSPTPALLKGTIHRLDPGREPDPQVRQWALRVLGRFGGFGLVGLVRHSTADPDPSVPPVAVDALLALAEGDGAAKGGALLVLGPLATSGDATLRTAARYAVLRLVRGEADDPPDFAEWWRGPLAGEAKIRALESFPRLKDPRGEDVVVPYLDDPDPAVASAAVRALAGIAAAGAPGERGAWLGTFPKDGASDVAVVKAWYSRRPR